MQLKTSQAKNPNDVSAKYYDFYTVPQKGESITEAEVNLIQKLLPANLPAKGNILDVGCGTGRHALALANFGYQVSGIDNSEGMLKIFREKVHALKTKKIAQNITIISGDILKKQLPLKNYDLIILFWNTFNEIALTKDKALALLCKLKQLLKKHGKILINIDNPQLLTLPNLHFTTSFSWKNKTYVQDWQVEKFIKAGKITTSAETIKVYTKTGQLLDETHSLIVQRWWGKKDLAMLYNQLNLKSEFVSLPDTEEFYIVLTRK